MLYPKQQPEVYGVSSWDSKALEGCLASRPWDLLPTRPRPRARLGGAGSPRGEFGDLRAQLFGQPDPRDVASVTLDVDGESIVVNIDPVQGLRWGLDPDDYISTDELMRSVGAPPDCRTRKRWDQLGVTEQEALLIIVAKRIKSLRQRRGIDAAGPVPGEATPVVEDAGEAKSALAARCRKELARAPVPWKMISIDTVTTGHQRRAPGLFYGIEFPWTEAMLLEWGPAWLTKAFHAAKTLEEHNEVTRIIPEKKVKVTTGNNGGKFLFGVEYRHWRPGLHHRLFAKVPFPLEGATRSDRLSSSVNKQPQEYNEFNTYRLLEATLPVRVPKFYFGDISTESTNWILITECVNFGDKAPTNFGRPKGRRRPLAPLKVEGPYDKCLDHNLRGDPREYYLLLVRTGARIAGLHKAGELGPEENLRVHFQYMLGLPPEAFRVSPGGPSGEDVATFGKKLESALGFISLTGKVLFPPYVTSDGFMGKFRRIMLLVNSYSGELTYWKHMNPDYVALTHQNMNVDNAYFWRDSDGNLDLGVFDWGGMGAMSVGHKLWWWLYCGDYEVLRDNLLAYVNAFVTTYSEHGGPCLDEDQLVQMVTITSLEQMIGLIGAVPQILKMCPKTEWLTIRDRYDARISENVDGKSTLRLYLHCMNSIVRIIEELDGGAVLEKWIENFWVGQMKMPIKPQAPREP